MNIVICDDEKAFADKLETDIRRMISANDRFCGLNLSCKYIYPPKALLDYSENEIIDILFLDINMPGIDGLKIAECFFDIHPETLIIFVTNYDEYVFRSLRFNPHRYLRKNRIDDELGEALFSALSLLMGTTSHLAVSDRNGISRVALQRIIYIEKEKATNYIKIVCRNEEYRDRRGIKELISTLDPSVFVRINVGTVVNVKHILSVKEDTVMLYGNHRLPVSKKYLPGLKKAFLEYMREHSR